MLSFRDRITVGLTRPAIMHAARRCIDDKRCFEGMDTSALIEQVAAEWMVTEMLYRGDNIQLTVGDIMAFIEKVLPLLLQLLAIIG